MDNQKLYRKIIMDNSIKPNTFVKQAPKEYETISAISETNCSELYKIFIKIEKNQIIDVKFKGVGCSISKAAINILSNIIKNKNTKIAINIILNYIYMINKKKFDKKIVEELIIFENISIHFNRTYCALLGANKIIEFLKNKICLKL